MSPFNSLFGILLAGLLAGLTSPPFNSLFGIQQRTGHRVLRHQGTFNSLFGIQHRLRRRISRTQLSTPFSGFYDADSTRGGQGHLPFNSLFGILYALGWWLGGPSLAFNSLFGIRRSCRSRWRGLLSCFQLPFRDSSSLLMPSMSTPVTFNSLFGIRYH